MSLTAEMILYLLWRGLIAVLAIYGGMRLMQDLFP